MGGQDTGGVRRRTERNGFWYIPTSTFETFPFTWPLGHEPQDDSRVQAIAKAARELFSHTPTLSRFYGRYDRKWALQLLPVECHQRYAQSVSERNVERVGTGNVVIACQVQCLVN